MNKFKSKDLAYIDINTIVKYQSGDMKASNDVICFYMQRIKKAIVAEFSTKNLDVFIDIEDIIQDGTIYFISAGLNFDTKNNDPKHFFNFCIKKTKWKILDYLRLRLRKKQAKVKNIEFLTETKIVETRENTLSEITAIDSINKALGKLSSRDEKICKELIMTEDISKSTLDEVGIQIKQCKIIYRNFKKELLKNVI